MKGSQNEVLNGKFHTTIPVGKLRRRQEDVVQRQTSQILGIRGWMSQRGMEASSAGRPGTRRGCCAKHGMKWRSIYFVALHGKTATVCLTPVCLDTF